MKKKSLLLTAVATLGLNTATMAQNVPNYVPTNGLVGWWPFNGNANDESGNGNNGTVNGASLSTDRFGNSNTSYYFDGFSSGIVVHNLLLSNSPTSYSVNFWCKLDTNAMDIYSNGYTVFDDCDSIQWKNKGRFLTLAAGGYINPNFSFREDYGNISEDLNPSYFGWTNYCCVLNTANNLFYLYKNGVLLDSSSFNPSFYAAGNRKMQFGRSQSPIQYNNLDYYTSHWLGSIDDIGIWNRALTQQEITDLYNGNICYQTITVTDTLLINMGITGYNPVTYSNTIKIFPNPTNDHITIDYGNFGSLSGYQLKIENSLGQQVFQTSINQQSTYLSLSNWGGNGLYFVRIIDPLGNTIDVRKIVLQ